MVNFEQLIQDIVKVIKKNGRKEITGQVLQEVLLDMVSKSQDAEAESILRDNNLQDAITKLGGDLETVNARLAEIGVSITELEEMATKAEDAIADHEQRIKENAGAIKANKDSIGKNADAIKTLQEKDIEQDKEIKNLKDTTQIVDLDVEIRNVGGGRYISSESAAEIYAYAIKGGNVKIQIDDKKYDFVEYKDRTAFFRNLEVSPDKVAEARIEIYEKDATFKSIEYTAIFDATPLLTSFNYQQPLTDEFIQKLNKALKERKLVYVNGNGTIYLLVGTSQSGDIRTFTGLGRNSVYVLSFGTNKIVSLDTHTIGVDIRIFNNENSVNILNLDTDSSNDEIQDVFTDSLGEILIPHTGDIFNIYQNADVSSNGSVESMVDDGAEIRLAVNMSNFEDNLVHRVFYNIAYNPSVGMNSLRITNKIENIINPSKIAESAIDRMQSEINANKGGIAENKDKVAKVANEVNEYNISHINKTTYDLQGAISALNAYLGDGARTIGIKVTFVDSASTKAKTYTYQGGSFVNVLSWNELVLEDRFEFNEYWQFNRINTQDKNIGDILDFKPVIASWWKHLLIPVKAGEVYFSYSNGVSNSRPYVLTDEDRKILEFAEGGAKERRIVVKEDGYLICNATSLDEYQPRFYIQANQAHEKRQDNSIEKLEGKAKNSFDKYMLSPLNIAYSMVGVGPINTKEHFITASKMGFNALKADIAITKDNVLICCHDSGFTLSGNRIAESFDSSNNTPIRELDYATIQTFEYERDHQFVGYYAKVCTIEQFLQICKTNGMIPFLTLRSDSPLYPMKETLDALFPLLKKYDFERDAIINMFPPSVEKCISIRERNKEVLLCWTHHFSKPLTISDIDSFKEYAPISVGIQQAYVDASAEAIAYAKENNILVMGHTISTFEKYQHDMTMGVFGGQLELCFLPYQPKSYNFNFVIDDHGDKLIFGNNYESRRYEGNLSIDKQSKTVTISDLRLKGSPSGSYDAILPLWMNKLPYQIVCSSGWYPMVRKPVGYWDEQSKTFKIVLDSLSADKVILNIIV